MRNIFVIPLLSIFFLLNCTKEISKSKLDPNLIGSWRIDSICAKSGKNCNYPTMDTWNKTNKSIVLKFKDTIMYGGDYHQAFEGRYFISDIEKDIRFQLKEHTDFLIRPQTKWQPFCIETLSNANNYDVMGEQLRIFAFNNEKTVYLTKK